MAVLITGGAGYLGSHAVRLFAQKGEKVIAYDNLSTGHREALPEELLFVGDLSETGRLSRIMREGGVDAVVHFAAKSIVPESMRDPEKYYENNVGGTLSLLRAMMDANVKKIVFSSTAAVYGEQKTMPLTENMPTNPSSVYGRSKLMIEQMMSDFDAAYGLKSISFRYFNVAGADPTGEIGEDHNPETHIIPNFLKHLLGKTEAFELYGEDYPTADGTCVRDYIEVCDLVRAHWIALKMLREGAETNRYNLGTGTGYSNHDIIRAAEAVTGRKANILKKGRRPGDPPTLVASSEKFIKASGWRPETSGLEAILSAAWKWHSTHPEGYMEKI